MNNIEIKCITLPDESINGLTVQVWVKIPVKQNILSGNAEIHVSWELIKDLGFDFCMKKISKELEEKYKEFLKKN